MNTKTQTQNGFWTPFIKSDSYFSLPLKLLPIFILFGIYDGESKVFSRMNSTQTLVADPPVIRIDVGTCTPAILDSVSNICFGYLSVIASATDDDTPVDDLTFEYKIDLFNDGVGAYNGYDCWVGTVSKNQLNGGMDPLNDYNIYTTNRNNPFDASGSYPIGIHKICWIVMDTSGFSATLCQLFEIKDCKAPTPYCKISPLVINLSPSGCISVFAKELNNGSYDNCTTVDLLKYYFNGDPTAIDITVCCQDFHQANVQDELVVELQMWIEDEEGNQDYCRTEILVKDPLKLCGGFDFGKISGEVYSIIDRKDRILAKNVTMELLKGNNLLRQQVVSNGNYLFANLPPAKYTLRASKVDEPFDSVSLIDIIRLRKHILGIEPQLNAYQLLVADVNNRQVISTAVLVNIKRLILRITDGFQNSLPWLLFPVLTPAPGIPSTSIEVDIKGFENKVIDFRAFKMGDVNNLVSSDSDKIFIPDPTDSLAFEIKNKLIRKAEKINVEFYAKNFNNISGYQFTIKFDRAILELDSIIKNSISTSDISNFGLRYVDTGYITTCWISSMSESQTFLPNEVLFTLAFEALEDGELCDLIQINSDLTPAQVCKDSATVLHNIVLDVCDVIIKTKNNIPDLFSVYPNPFRDEIHFQFSETLHFPLQIELISSDGKIKDRQNLNQAIPHWTWKKESLNSGVYILSIKNDQQQIIRKIMFAH